MKGLEDASVIVIACICSFRPVSFCAVACCRLCARTLPPDPRVLIGPHTRSRRLRQRPLQPRATFRLTLAVFHPSRVAPAGRGATSCPPHFQGSAVAFHTISLALLDPSARLH